MENSALATRDCAPLTRGGISLLNRINSEQLIEITEKVTRMPECDPDRLATPQAFLHGQLLALDFLLGARHAILTEFLHFYKKLGVQAMALERRRCGVGVCEADMSADPTRSLVSSGHRWGRQFAALGPGV